MARRLISPPADIGVTSIEPLSGPRAVGSGITQSIGDFTQTFGSPFGVWRFRFSFHPMQGSAFRRYRGWVTALHGGANATRWSFFDPDMMSFREAGVAATEREALFGQSWSNGMPWSNGRNWETSRPNVPVAAPAALGATLVSLSDQWWGSALDVGDYLGFFPFHFGLYAVTEILDCGAYRVWPPLRKAVSRGDFATLSPTLALKLEGEDGASAGRNLVVAEGLSATLVEVFDYDVRDYFTE